MTTRTMLAAAALLLPIGLAACAPQPAAPQSQAKADHKAAMAALPEANMAAAQALLTPDETLQVLDMPMKGSKTVQGRIVGYKTVAYAVPMAAGQTLKVTFDSPISAAGFNILDVAKGQEAVFRGEIDGRSASVTTQAATTLVIRPGQQRAAARRGTAAAYTLAVTRE